MSASPYVMNDPRLEFDAAAHVYRLGERVLPSVTQILAAVGLSDFSAPHFTEAVRDRGSMVHAAIMLDNEGDLDEETLDPQLVPYLSGWRRFLQESCATIEFWEQRLCDPDLGVAGTLDGVILLEGASGRTRRVIVDVKRGHYPSASIQLAAYQHMAYALYPKPVVFERAVVELPGDGNYRVHTFTDHLDRTTWQAAVRLYQWRAQHGLAA